MSPETLRFVLQVAAVMLGGGSVQMAIFLLKRRSELRSLDATAGSTALTSANAYISTLQSGEKAIREELDKLQSRFDTAKKQWDSERATLAEDADNQRQQARRLTRELGRCKADLEVAELHIQELTRQGRQSARHSRRLAE